jgi:hypothetical protein
MKVNQGDANEGGCLTLGRNSKGVIGFFIYKGTNIPPYRAFLTVNKIGNARLFKITDEEPTDIKSIDSTATTTNSDVYYNLSGQRVQHPSKGIYIHNGRKVIIK